MIRFLPYALELFLVILFFPLIGAIAWLVTGRPLPGPRRQVPWPSTRAAGFPEYERPRRSVAPDDDPEFLAQMRKGNAEQEELLRTWEDVLRRRERELGKDDEPPPAT